nr:hypothetical protein [Pseudonocardia cypriaca]
MLRQPAQQAGAQLLGELVVQMGRRDAGDRRQVGHAPGARRIVRHGEQCRTGGRGCRTSGVRRVGRGACELGEHAAEQAAQLQRLLRIGVGPAPAQLFQPAPGAVGRRRGEPEPDVTGPEDQVRQTPVVQHPGQVTGQQLQADVDVQHVEIDDIPEFVPAPRADRHHLAAFELVAAVAGAVHGATGDDDRHLAEVVGVRADRPVQ